MFKSIQTKQNKTPNKQKTIPQISAGLLTKVKVYIRLNKTDLLEGIYFVLPSQKEINIHLKVTAT